MDIYTVKQTKRKKFQPKIDDKSPRLYNIKVNEQFILTMTNYGARMVSLKVPDKDCVQRDIILGFESIEDYLHSPENYYGAIIGRYTNRISNACFDLEGIKYKLNANDNNTNSLHGGPKGFHNVVWDVVGVTEESIVMHYLSKDDEEGFPGNLHVTVIYSVEENNQLSITYKATTDKKTVINFTNHAFFNLNGGGTGSVLAHNLLIKADRYLPINNNSIPLGFFEHVALTPFDFKATRTIGKSIQAEHIQLQIGNCYDHCFALNKGITKSPELVAVAEGDQSGIILNVYTTEPGMQLYTGNFMKGNNQLRGSFTDDFRTAFCLETQHYPNSPNEPIFPSTILEPGILFESKTIYEFPLIGK